MKTLASCLLSLSGVLAILTAIVLAVFVDFGTLGLAALIGVIK